MTKPLPLWGWTIRLPRPPVVVRPRTRRGPDPRPHSLYCNICSWPKNGAGSWSGSACRCGFSYRYDTPDPLLDPKEFP